MSIKSKRRSLHKGKNIVKTSKSKSKSNSNYNFNSNSNILKGGDDGRFALPPSYFGKGTRGYFPSGSSELSNNKQHAVSRGTISSDGLMSGPNLFPMKGGNCGCKKQKKNNSNNKKSKKCKKCNKSNKSNKSKKSKKSKKSNNSNNKSNK